MTVRTTLSFPGLGLNPQWTHLLTACLPRPTSPSGLLSTGCPLLLAPPPPTAAEGSPTAWLRFHMGCSLRYIFYGWKIGESVRLGPRICAAKLQSHIFSKLQVFTACQGPTLLSACCTVPNWCGISCMYLSSVSPI